MRIGIVGTGNMGRALGLGWARAGHELLFGSRDVKKAKAVAADSFVSAQTGDFDAAAVFGDVILYTIRDYFPSSALKEPQALAGKIVIDCNNSAILGLDLPDPGNRPGIHFTTPIPSHAEELAADAPGARVVKAFNTMAAQVIELDRDELMRRRVSVFLCSDDAQAKSVVKELAEELGFIGRGLRRAGAGPTGGRCRRLHSISDHRYESRPVCNDLRQCCASSVGRTAKRTF